MLDEDLEAIVTEGILRTADVFVLDYLHVTAGTTVLPMASVRLKINGRPAQDAGYGNGPIDAAYNTIAKLTGTSLRAAALFDQRPDRRHRRHGRSDGAPAAKTGCWPWARAPIRTSSRPAPRPTSTA
ncbi:MAG: hypothetical protein MZV70_08340 [Desulfobacterales bacterium]|nr:hypothetical protein [Desulfobacterales bacterium]